MREELGEQKTPSVHDWPEETEGGMAFGELPGVCQESHGFLNPLWFKASFTLWLTYDYDL